MPIGLVSNLDFDLELNSLKSGSIKPAKDVVHEGTIIDKPHRGRSVGDNNVPESLRKIIGETAVIDGRDAAINLANEFGISPSSVSAYAKGATSTTSYNEPKLDIVAHLNKSRQRAIKRASVTLNQSLKSITQEKLDYADPKDLAGIAKDMSVIIKNLEPQEVPSNQSDKSTPQFVIFAPQFRQENSFDHIIVPE